MEIFNGTSFLKHSPQVVLQTDTSLFGWSPALQEKGFLCYSSRKEIAYKELELLAVKLAIQTFLKSQKFTSIHVQMNNIVALTYLKKIGGTRNQKLTILLKEIWEILISEQIMIAVEYLPSSLNKRRTCNLAAKWTHLSWSSVGMAFAISA